MFISSFLQPFTGGQGEGVSLWAEQRHFSLTFRERGRVPRGRPLCMPIAIERSPAMESKGQSKRNRSNMESDFVLPCSILTTTFQGEIPCTSSAPKTIHSPYTWMMELGISWRVKKI